MAGSLPSPVAWDLVVKLREAVQKSGHQQQLTISAVAAHSAVAVVGGDAGSARILCNFITKQCIGFKVCFDIGLDN